MAAGFKPSGSLDRRVKRSLEAGIMADPTAQAGAAPPAAIPPIYTNQQLINAFYYAAEALGLADYRELMEAAGLSVDQLAAERDGIHTGQGPDEFGGLTGEQLGAIRRELLGELLKQVRWVGLVNAPDGLNLRRTPGTEAPPLALLPHETLLQVLNDGGDWLFVVAEGQAGYVFAAHVLRRLPPAPSGGGTPGLPGSEPGGEAGDRPGGEEEGFAPPPEEQVEVPPGAGAAARTVAEVWNRYGALLTQEAARLQFDATLATALLAAESAGRAYGPDGRLLIRFENHIFYEMWGKHNQAQFFALFRFDGDQRWRGHQWRPDAHAEWQNVHVDDQAMEWRVFLLARQLDDTAAMLSISMGLPQIMGFNHAMIGFGAVQEMLRAFQASVAHQIAGFFHFVEARNLAAPVRAGDLRTFAAGYNGSGQAETYAGIIRSYAAALTQLRAPTPAQAAHMMEQQMDENLIPVVSAPMPPSPKPGVPLAEADPELYAAWRRHVEQGLANNQVMFKRVLDAFMSPYWTTVWTYRILIGIGIGGFLVAAVLGWRDAQWPVTAIFGGLSVVAFLTYFLSRPLQALEENLQFITWLGVVYNSYWTRLANAQNAETFQADLSAATNEFVQQLQQLVNAHGERSDKRPKIDGA
jgi:hypothetical protein